jgi:hypothetical protein
MSARFVSRHSKKAARDQRDEAKAPTAAAADAPTAVMGPQGGKSLMQMMAEQRLDHPGAVPAHSSSRAGQEPAGGAVPARETTWRAAGTADALLPPAIALLRKTHRIRVVGLNNFPRPAAAVADLKLPPALAQHAQVQLRLQALYPLQQHALPCALAGYHTVCVGPAHSGKGFTAMLTAALTLIEARAGKGGEATQGKPSVLFLCASRELEERRCTELRRLCSAHGHRFGVQRGSLMRGGDAVVMNASMLVRDVDAPDSTVEAQLTALSLVVVEEAHRVVQLKGFEALWPTIAGAHPQVLVMTDAIERVRSFIDDRVPRPLYVQLTDASPWCGVAHAVQYAPDEHKLLLLLAALQRCPPPALVVVMKHHDVEDTVAFLANAGIRADNNVARFSATGGEVLVATDAVLGGAAVPSVQHIVNFTLPFAVCDGLTARARLFDAASRRRTCLMTTFINRHSSDIAAQDLVLLLQSAGHSIPRFLSGVAPGRAAERGRR